MTTKTVPTQKASLNEAKRSFEEDINPLTFMISHHRSVAKLELESLIRDKNRSFVEEDKIRKLADSAASGVLNSLSEGYKEILALYYTEDAIVDFVTTQIAVPLIDRSTEINRGIVAGNRNTGDDTPTGTVDTGVLASAKDM